MFHQLLRRRTRGAILRLTVSGGKVWQEDRNTGKWRYVPATDAVVIAAAVQFNEGSYSQAIPVPELVGVRVWGVKADPSISHVRGEVILAARRAGILALKTGLLNDSSWKFSWR